MMSKTLQGRLSEIQSTLDAPKGQYNSFGKYHYRSCEDILKALKPLLQGLTIVVSDEIVHMGNNFYVKATACISDGTTSVEAHGWAREPAAKKGMDDSQITGATSSYARKYALNGLFAIDDNKDADATNDHGKVEQNNPPNKVTHQHTQSSSTPAPLSKERFDAAVEQVIAGNYSVHSLRTKFKLTEAQEKTLVKKGL